VKILNKLKNTLLELTVNRIGAELSEIKSVKHSTEFMWQANPDIWANHAPNLFPIVGALKNDTYNLDGKTFSLPKHGFVRSNKNIVLESKSENELVYKLTYNEETLKQFPFKFNYYVNYKLIENTLDITYKVENIDDKTMYFSLGGHPAFNCPLYKDEHYSDYSLEFEKDELSKPHLLDLGQGLVSHNTEAVFTSAKAIQLQPDLFNKDALIFKDLTSRSVTLKHNTKGPILSMHYNDFNYFGVWAKPNASYVCLEPWLGIADHINTNQDFKTKDGIITLEPNKSFKASYQIEIALNHLV
jgi:galactose mutarotase-like enzyme